MKQPPRIGEAVRSPVARISRRPAATETPPEIKRISAKRISAHEAIHTLPVAVVYATLATRLCAAQHQVKVIELRQEHFAALQRDLPTESLVFGKGR